MENTTLPDKEDRAWINYVDILVETGIIDEWISNSGTGGYTKNELPPEKTGYEAGLHPAGNTRINCMSEGFKR